MQDLVLKWSAFLSLKRRKKMTFDERQPFMIKMGFLLLQKLALKGTPVPLI